MKIIYNDSLVSHHKVILNLLKKSDELFIASPFLTPDFGTLIDYSKLNKLCKLTILTTLKPKTPDQINKVLLLHTLIENIGDSKNLFIYIDNKLHAKVYLFKKEGHYISAIISSANFTWKGVEKNHEIGVQIFDRTLIKNLESLLVNEKIISRLDFANIEKMKNDVDNYLEKNSQPKDEQIKLDLTKYISGIQKEESLTYWLKPLGVTEDPVTENRIFSKFNEKLFFSKKKPTGVRIGDIMIAYGVGPTKILSVYRVKSGPIALDPKIIEKYPKRARWPWYVMGENLTPNYGEIWAANDLRLHQLKEDFMKVDSTGILTIVGGNTFGAFNRGLDKVRLRKEFAEYIIGRVFQLNNE